MEQGPIFGALVRQRRKSLDLTQAQLAQLVGCTTDMLRKIEGGLRRPSQQLAARLAASLAVTHDDRGAFLRSARQLPGGGAPPPARPVLPAPPTQLVGREHDLRAVEALLLDAGARLVTLTGPGGVGKSRCALACAAAVDARFAHGVTLVPLAALADHTLVMLAVAQALGLRDVDATTAAASVANYLRRQHRLLLIDNLEHLLPAAPALGALLAACPQLKLLATSRAALRLSAEHEYALPPLALPDLAALPPAEQLRQSPAVALLDQRARMRWPQWRLNADNARAVAQLSVCLDGLPLALELAAARLRVFTPQQLLAQLACPGEGGALRINVLSDGPHDLAPRHQSLRSTLAWSYNLLGEAAQRVFARLAVFAGGASFEAIADVCAEPAAPPLDVLRQLTALAESSLIQQQVSGDEMRFSLLETVRAFALERLEDSGAGDATRARHAAYYAGLARDAHDRLYGPAQEATLRRLDQEHDNMRAALRWALDAADAPLALGLGGYLGRYWNVRCLFSDGRRWLAAALRLPNEDGALRALALDALAMLARRQGDYAAARDAVAQSLPLWRALGDASGLARSLSVSGVTALDQGNVALARPQLEEARRLYEQQGDKAGLAVVLNNFGNLVRQEQSAEDPSTWYEASYSLWRELSDQWGQAVVLNSLGISAGVRGEYAAASRLFNESLRFSRAIGNRNTAGAALLNLANLARLEEQPAQAWGYAAESLALWQQLGDRQGTIDALDALAGALVQQQRALQAAWLWGAVETLRVDGAIQRLADEQAEHGRLVASARSQVSAADFVAAWERGRAEPFDQVLDALAALHSQSEADSCN